MFDRITALAAEMLEVPVAVVSLVDTNRVWYKSVHGPVARARMRRLPGLCGAAMRTTGPMSSRTPSADPRTQEHPLVAGPFGLEFYVGVPLRTHDGHALGVLSCMDVRPRGLTPRELRFLETLAAIVMDEIELRRSAQPDLAAERGAGRDLQRPGAAGELRPADRGAGALGDAGARRALLERAAAGDKGAAC